MEDKQMKIILTGSSGYIGSNFIKLYNDTYDIIEIDKKIGKSISGIKAEDYKDAKHIVHLAAISGIQACEDDKIQTIKDNVLTLNNIWMMSALNDIPVTFASSQAAKDGNNTYSFTKMIGEQFLMNESNSVCVLRFSNVYGGINYLETKTSVVSKFVNALKNDDPLLVYGDGTQVRDFIHVDDICKAIHLSIQLKNKANITLDIGTGIPVSIYDLAMFIDGSGVMFRKNADIGVKGNIADITEAEKILEFKAEKSLKEYINKIVVDNI